MTAENLAPQFCIHKSYDHRTNKRTQVCVEDLLRLMEKGFALGRAEHLFQVDRHEGQPALVEL